MMYIVPRIRAGHLVYVIYDHQGQPITEENTREQALLYAHEVTNPEAVIYVGALQNVFEVAGNE